MPMTISTRSADRKTKPSGARRPPTAGDGAERSEARSFAPFELRPYQAEGVEEIRDALRRGNRRVLRQLPTGGGKTVEFAYIVRSAVVRGSRVCILVHRIELIEQTSRTLAAQGVERGIVAPGHPRTDETVQIASVMTLARRLATWKEAFDFLIVDEAHHAVAASWQTILGAFPKARVLGVTATPERLDGRGLGEFFEHLIIGPSVAELTKLGFLAKAAVYAPSRQVDLIGVRTIGGDFDQAALQDRMMEGGLVGDAVEHYRKYADALPAIAFCVGIKHSLSVAAAYRPGWVHHRMIEAHGATP
jgi:DNA repair protein RadD